MKSQKKLIEAVKNGKLFWNDPDFIVGNDYKITFIKFFVDADESLYVDDTALIQYGGGSEAEVYISELIVKK